MPASKPDKPRRTRRTQERAERTRANLLAAASNLFTEHGYEGVSIRDIETQAEAQRGLLAYHFGDKAGMWRAMADETFAHIQGQLAERREVIAELPERERLAFIIRFYVRFSAEHPQLARLLSQEARHASWRLTYLGDNHIDKIAQFLRPAVASVLGLNDEQFVHWYYLLAGGSSLIFSHAPECDMIFGYNPHTERAVEMHAQMMVNALLGAQIPSA